MVEQKYIELINREIDGENFPADSAKLQTYLSRHNEARQIYHELVACSTMLNRTRHVEPPKNLKRNILKGIRPELAGGQKAASAWSAIKSFAGLERGRPSLKLKYGLSFAFGLAAGLFTYSVIDGTTGKDGSVDIPNLYGTITTQEPSSPFTQTSTTAIDLPQASGTISMKSSREIIVLDLLLRAEEKVHVVLELDGNLMLSSFESIKSSDGSTISASADFFRVNDFGDGKYVLSFTRKTPADASWRFKIYTDDSLLYEKSFAITPAGQ